MKQINGRFRLFWAAFGGALFLLLLFGFPGGVMSGIGRGIALCGSVIVPSMLPMLALCGFFIRTGLASAAGKALAPVTERLFALPGAAASAILMSMIGGYPAGAKMIEELYRRDELTDGEGERMLWFCVGAGPGFLVSAVGVGMLGSAKVGWLLFAAQTLAIFSGGLVSRFLFRNSTLQKNREKSAPASSESPVIALVSAVSDATQSTLVICAFVALLSGVVSGLRESGVSAVLAPLCDRLFLPSGATEVILPALFEVGGGCAAAAEWGGNSALAMAFISGWGGLSVHFQVLSLVQKMPLSKAKFWLGRVFSMLLTGGAAFLLFRVISGAVPAAAAASAPFLLSSRNAPASVALLLFCAFLVLASPEKERKTRAKNRPPRSADGSTNCFFK